MEDMKNIEKAKPNVEKREREEGTTETEAELSTLTCQLIAFTQAKCIFDCCIIVLALRRRMGLKVRTGRGRLRCLRCV